MVCSSVNFTVTFFFYLVPRIPYDAHKFCTFSVTLVSVGLVWMRVDTLAEMRYLQSLTLVMEAAYPSEHWYRHGVISRD